MSYLDFDFPHTRFFESDLRELIKQVFIMNDLVTNFVSINAIKYANPIQWDITKSYEKNTVVIDGNSGVAYISVRPVPAGIALTREQYWTKVFDLSIFITKGAANFAVNYESEPTTTATKATAKDRWVVWDTTLYQALTDIHPGDRYVPDGNIKKMTVEEFYNLLKSIIDNEIHERETGDDALEVALDEETELRAEGDSALHREIVDESVARENADTTLQDNIDEEASARSAANTALSSKIGNLESLVTNNKTNLVDAINEVFNLPKGTSVNVRDFGALGNRIYYNKADGNYYADVNYTTTPPDDGAAFDAAIQNATENNKKYIYIPAGYYYLPNKTFGLNENLTFIGEGNSYLVSTGLTGDANFININVTSDMLEYGASPTLISGITILGNYFTAFRKTNANGVAAISIGDSWVQHRNIVNVGVLNFDVGFRFRAAVETRMNHCSVCLCNAGIVFNESNGGYNPIPFFFENGTIELNGTGIYAPNGGYSTVHVINSGFSGGRMAYYGKSNLYITGCRMEYAIDALCDNNGTPNAAIEVYSTSGGDADSGIMIDNCEVLTTASGYWDAIDLFVTLPHYTRVADNKFLWHIYQPYGGQSCDAMINNTLYNPGDKNIPILCYAEGGTVTGKVRTTIVANKASMLGAFTLNAEALGKYTNITHTGGTGISVSDTATVSIKLSTNDQGVIAHLPSNVNITHRYLTNGQQLSSISIASSGSNYYQANTASRKPIGADEVQIIIPPEYYGEAWIEVI